MSAKYSTSPTLHLAINESAHYRYCQLGFHLGLLLSLLQLALGGFPVCWALLPLIPLSCYLHRRQRQAGLTLCWQQGRWSLLTDAGRETIELQRGHCLPWVTFVQWRPAEGRPAEGRVDRAWLFSDSCPRSQLRRLRVRLRLERVI